MIKTLLYCDNLWSQLAVIEWMCWNVMQIQIPETEYYQYMSSHAQIEPQGAEKQ